MYYEGLVNNDVEIPDNTLCKSVAEELNMHYVQSRAHLGMGILSKVPIVKVLSNELCVLAVLLENGKASTNPILFTLDCLRSNIHV